MRAAGPLAALLLLAVATARAEVTIQTIQEDNLPGQSSGTYAIVEDGRVVGMVQRYQASSQLRSSLGRRAGPSSDARLPSPAERLLALVGARLDVVGALQTQLLASRCPLARQMALARMQAAAAAAGLLDGAAAAEQPFPMPRGGLRMRPRLFGDAVEEQGLLQRRGPWTRRHVEEPLLVRDPRAQPLPLDAMAHAADDFAFAEPEPLDPFRPVSHAPGSHGPFEVPRRPHHHHARPHWQHSEGPEELEGHAREARPFQPPLLLRGGVPVEWERLQNTAMPAPPPEPEVNWRLRDPDGSLNWGLLTFVALAAACATVWGALVAQWAAYCRARAVHRAQAAFITAVEADPALQPLLGAKAVGKEGLEYAVAYVAPSARNVAVMTQFDEAAKL